MKKLLYLVHRLPYPPNKGDKISSFNMLKYYSEHWRVHLGTFIDDPDDWQHTDTVKAYCEDSIFINLPRHKMLTGSVRGLLTGRPLSLSYYDSPRLQEWVRESVAREKPDAVLIFSGVMGQFVRPLLPLNVPIVFDAEDVDSEKWRGYARAKAWPLSMLYTREADKLLSFERDMAAHTTSSIFVSDEEADIFRGLAPESADKTFYRTQGVDSEYFSPEHHFDNPYEVGQKVLVFSGAMDYPPNIDAVSWFAQDMLPQIREKIPDVLFCIVGMKPTDEVKKLGQLPNVRVTGGVPDVRPFIHHAMAACLPMRIAHGIQNKSLEAMSMTLPVLATTAAMIGIRAHEGNLAYISDDADGLIELAIDLLSTPRRTNTGGRECVTAGYNWEANLKKLEQHLLAPAGKSEVH